MSTDQTPAPDNAPGPSLWRNRDFLLLWFGDAISSLGSQASQLALPLLALAVTGSPAQVGLLGAIRGAIYLLFGLPAGALIDRWNRRAVMIVADGCRALAFASIPLALLGGWLTMPQLFAVAAIEGLGFVAYGLAHTASTPRIVPRSQLPTALAQSQFLESISRTIGPTLGGALFTAGRALPFIVDAASYALATVAMLAIRTPLAAPPATTKPHLGREIVAGLAWLRRVPDLLALTLVNGAVNFIYGGMPLLIITLAQGRGADATAIGLIFTLGGLGTATGAALAPTILRRLAVGAIIIGCLWVFAIVWALYALVPGLLGLALLFAGGLALAGIYNGASLAHRLVRTPDAMQGRVVGVARLLTYGGQAAGYALTGVLLQQFGTATVWALLLPSLLVAAATTASGAARRVPRVAEVETAPA